MPVIVVRNVTTAQELQLNLDVDTLSMQDNGSREAAQSRFTLQDPGLAFDLLEEDEIQITDIDPGTADVLFGGFARPVSTMVEAIGRSYSVVAYDYSTLLDRIDVVQVDRPAGESTRDRLGYLLTTFGADLLDADMANVLDIAALPAQKFRLLSLRQAIEKVLGAAGLTIAYKMRADKKLEVWDTLTGNGTAPFNIRIGNPGAGEIAPEDLRTDGSSTELRNVYWVRGATAAGSGYFTSPASIARYGRREAYQDAPDADLAWKAYNVGVAALRDNEWPRQTGVFSAYSPHDGWRSRQRLLVTSPMHLTRDRVPMDEEPFDIASVTTTYLNGLGARRYEITFGSPRAKFTAKHGKEARRDSTGPGSGGGGGGGHTPGGDGTDDGGGCGGYPADTLGAIVVRFYVPAGNLELAMNLALSSPDGGAAVFIDAVSIPGETDHLSWYIRDPVTGLPSVSGPLDPGWHTATLVGSPTSQLVGIDGAAPAAGPAWTDSFLGLGVFVDINPGSHSDPVLVDRIQDGAGDIVDDFSRVVADDFGGSWTVPSGSPYEPPVAEVNGSQAEAKYVWRRLPLAILPAACPPDAALVDCGCLPFIAGTPISSDTFTVRDYDARITRVKGTAPAGGVGDHLTTAGLTAFQIFLQDFGADVGDGEPSEYEARFYVSHNAPSGASQARLRCRVVGRTVNPPNYGVALGWALYKGTFGASAPSWGSVGEVLASGQVNPDSTTVVIGNADIVDVVLPVVEGRVQMVLAFNSQVLTNGYSSPPPTLAARPRYPGFLPEYGQSDDVLLTVPIDATDFVSNQFYTLDWYGSEPVAPLAGQTVGDELIGTGDGTTTAFRTAYGYAPASLRVEVDGVHVAATESDPSAGEFTLPFAPGATETIRASYQGFG